MVHPHILFHSFSYHSCSVFSSPFCLPIPNRALKKRRSIGLHDMANQKPFWDPGKKGGRNLGILFTSVRNIGEVALLSTSWERERGGRGIYGTCSTRFFDWLSYSDRICQDIWKKSKWWEMDDLVWHITFKSQRAREEEAREGRREEIGNLSAEIWLKKKFSSLLSSSSGNRRIWGHCSRIALKKLID